MTGERDGGPVPGFPGWHWWTGVNGMLYARRPLTSPPMVVRARDYGALLERIQVKEEAHVR